MRWQQMTFGQRQSVKQLSSRFTERLNIFIPFLGYNPYAASTEQANSADAAVQEEHAASLLLLAKMSNLSGIHDMPT